MAFKRSGGQSGTKPTLSVAMSVKQGTGYIKGPSFGLWSNEEGGPAYRGTLKGEYLAQALEFLSNAYEAQLPVSLAVFDNTRGQGGGGFKKPSGFGGKKTGFGTGPKKPNPFARQQQPETEEEPEFEE